MGAPLQFHSDIEHVPCVLWNFRENSALDLFHCPVDPVGLRGCEQCLVPCPEVFRDLEELVSIYLSLLRLRNSLLHTPLSSSQIGSAVHPYLPPTPARVLVPARVRVILSVNMGPRASSPRFLLLLIGPNSGINKPSRANHPPTKGWRTPSYRAAKQPHTQQACRDHQSKNRCSVRESLTVVLFWDPGCWLAASLCCGPCCPVYRFSSSCLARLVWG